VPLVACVARRATRRNQCAIAAPVNCCASSHFTHAGRIGRPPCDTGYHGLSAGSQDAMEIRKDGKASAITYSWFPSQFLDGFADRQKHPGHYPLYPQPVEAK